MKFIANITSIVAVYLPIKCTGKIQMPIAVAVL